jgi:hypothetical protein
VGPHHSLLAVLRPVLEIQGGVAGSETECGLKRVVQVCGGWNGSPLSTSYISGNQLTFSVPAGLIASQGTASAIVRTMTTTFQGRVPSALSVATEIGPNDLNYFSLMYLCPSAD